MPLERLKVHLDHRQPRLARDAVAFVVSGSYDGNVVKDRPVSGWSTLWRDVDGNGDDKTAILPVLDALCLTPLPLTREWQTNFSDDFARILKASYTLTTGANWADHSPHGGTASYLHSIDSGVNEAVKTTATFEANQPFWLSVYAPDFGADTRKVIQFGWDYTNRNTTGGVFVDVWSDGRCDFYFDGALQSSTNLSDVPDKSGSPIHDDWLKFCVIPVKYGLLIWSNRGSCHVQRDGLDTEDADAVITPAANFWWYVPDGAATVELAQLRFRESGYRASLTAKWTKAPELGDDDTYLSYVGGDTATTTFTPSFVEADDATTTFVPNGVKKSARVRYDLTGDGDHTRYIFAAAAGLDGMIRWTDDSEMVEVTPYISSASLDVPEDDGSPTFRFTLTNLKDMEDEVGVVPLLETLSWRPIKVSLGDSMMLLDGIGHRPRVSRSTTGNADKIDFEVGGLSRMMEVYRFKDPWPLDGYDIRTVLQFLASRAGFPVIAPDDRTDIEDIEVTVGSAASPGKGEFQEYISVGETSMDVWRRVFETYLPDCHWTEKPTASGETKLVVHTAEGIPDRDPPFRIFDRVEDARSYLETIGYTGADLDVLAPSRVFRTLDEDGIESEANEVWVQGLDRGTFRPIVVYDEDDPAKDPELKPSERPSNWTGIPRAYGLINEGLATEAQCEDAVGRLVARLNYPRFLRELEIDFMVHQDGVPMWTGEKVEVQTRRDDDDAEIEVYRIVRFGGDFVKEVSDAEDGAELVARPFRYVLEKVVEDGAQGLGHSLPGASIFEMKAFKSYLAVRNFTPRMPAVRSPRIVAEDAGNLP